MLKPIQPFVDYAFNYDYISKVLCINKDKPAIGCNGKCHLAKQVQKEQQNNTKSLLVSLKEYPIGFVEIMELNSYHFEVLQLNNHPNYMQTYTFDVNNSILQPPELFHFTYLNKSLL